VTGVTTAPHDVRSGPTILHEHPARAKHRAVSLRTSTANGAVPAEVTMTLMLDAATTTLPGTRTRAAGIAIAAATLASTVAVAFDHGGGGTTPLAILEGIARLQGLKELVHGVAIASVCAYAFGYAALARRLGLERPLALAGLVTTLLGCAAMIGATVLDGFVVPHVAADAIAGTPARVAFAYDLVHYLGVVLNDLAKLGWVLQAAGAIAWSTLLLRMRGAARWTGAIGVLSSGAVVALLVASATNMTMASLLAVLVAQMAWNLAAAAWLMRREF
jgi:hypothetical protein